MIRAHVFCYDSCITRRAVVCDPAKKKKPLLNKKNSLFYVLIFFSAEPPCSETLKNGVLSSPLVKKYMFLISEKARRRRKIFRISPPRMLGTLQGNVLLSTLSVGKSSRNRFQRTISKAHAIYLCTKIQVPVHNMSTPDNSQCLTGVLLASDSTSAFYVFQWIKMYVLSGFNLKLAEFQTKNNIPYCQISQGL